MLDDLLTSCALTLVAAGIAVVGAEVFDSAQPAQVPAVAAASAETIQLPTVVVVGRRAVPVEAETLASAE